jgi:hypothetical protein
MRAVAAAPTAFNPAAIDAQHTSLRSQLRDAAGAFLAALPADDEQTRRDWLEYLRWNSWAKPLLATGGCDVAELKRTAWRFYAARDGFEHPLLVAMRKPLSDYVTFEEAVAAAHGDLAGEYRRRLDQLQQAAAATPPDRAALEEAAWWLSILRQAPTELAAVRRRFPQPTIVVQVHRDLVENKLATFERTSQEQRTTRRQIQGATVAGQSLVVSHTTAELVDDAAEARLRITTHGAVAAPHNVSTANRVRVVSSSHADFTVTAEVYWDGQRFTHTPPQASAAMRTTIRGISAPRLLRRAAERRVDASRGAAQAEGESLIEREAVEAMTARLAIAVDKLEQKTAEFLAFITRTGNTAVRWTTEVRPTSVQVGFLPPSDAGLGAAPHVIPPLANDETLGLSFHDGAFECILRGQLAGKTWTDVNFSHLQHELTGSNNPELLVGLDPGRWSVRWSWRRPVSIHFSPEFATVAYRFERVEIDGSAYDAPFEVRARVTASAPPLGFEMKLLEPATVVSLDPQRPLPPHFQGFLERKFRGLFGEGFSLDNMQFPAGGTLNGMSQFRVAGVTMEDQWVHLRYTNRAPRAEFVSSPRDAPGTTP